MELLRKSAIAAALTAACVSPSFGQSTQSTVTTNEAGGIRMPYQKDFWTTGHVGASVGRGKLDTSCPTGASCDDTATALKLHAGGRFSNVFGGELSYLQTEDFERSGGGVPGDVSLQAVNFGLLAGIPFGPGKNSSIFGKLGLLWGHAEAGASSQNGWGPSIGAGALIGVNRNWAVRLDWDRWRFKMPGGGGDRENIDTVMIGAQYTFGNPR
jgi:opacity protein-like surface antigen